MSFEIVNRLQENIPRNHFGTGTDERGHSIVTQITKCLRTYNTLRPLVDRQQQQKFTMKTGLTKPDKKNSWSYFNLQLQGSKPRSVSDVFSLLWFFIIIQPDTIVSESNTPKE